jgi:hypothetical protein
MAARCASLHHLDLTYIHLCSDAAGIIHQPADFPYETPVVRG